MGDGGVFSSPEVQLRRVTSGLPSPLALQRRPVDTEEARSFQLPGFPRDSHVFLYEKFLSEKEKRGEQEGT